MEYNREEASRARRIALNKLANKDFFAEAKINGNLDLYAILQVEATEDNTAIRKQYNKLAFWLHRDENTLPGAEAAFKLVSEAHTTLCDQTKRSLYDIKIRYASREVKRFVYYQRNFVVGCDDCGKNFFAFKLHEQAVPSRFLSAAPNNSQVPPEMFSCQQHGVVPNQQVQYTKLKATGGEMDSKPMVHATHTDEHIKWDGGSGGYGEGSSETRSNVVQFSAVNQTHSPSPSGDKDTTGSMASDPPDPKFVATQNLSREDASAVVGKRKQDGADYSQNRDSCNNKRQRKYNSLSDADSSDEKMFNGNVAGADNKSTEHLHRKLGSQEEGNATHKGNQQEYKNETTDIGNQMSSNPIITYECPDFFDFGKLRDLNKIAVDQIWAIYDDHDFMPRVYAQINHVDASSLKVQLTWLVHNAMTEQEAKWAREEYPVACGNFCLGERYVLQDPSMYFSHAVSWTKGKNGNSFDIHPKKGELWALHKEWSMPWSSDAYNHRSPLTVVYTTCRQKVV
ncbi:uncharacterized protein LOC133901047 [Phragmites australis]|uniref:uncharacterized protein LOC133901047 n=1 Tax=Phragmites australis TaxID=29695 RepID=UPI002D76F58A|nr:uncharacterized protein LOC133901047 [Phragmites australis]